MHSKILDKIEKIVVVVGCQRSGTTLVGLMLGASEQALMLDESDGVYSWFDSYIRGTPDTDSELLKVLESAGKKYKLSTSRIVKDQQTHTELSTTIKYLVLKTPNLTHRLVDLLTITIPVAVVYAVRNPLAVVSSMLSLQHIDMLGNQIRLLKDIPNLNPDINRDICSVKQSEERKHINLGLIWKIKSGFFSHYQKSDINTFLCRYEELAESPESTCKQLCESLDIQFSPLMLQHHQTYKGFAQGRTNRARAIDRDSLNKWRSQLTQKQVEEILVVTKPTMKLLGYT